MRTVELVKHFELDQNQAEWRSAAYGSCETTGKRQLVKLQNKI